MKATPEERDETKQSLMMQKQFLSLVIVGLLRMGFFSHSMIVVEVRKTKPTSEIWNRQFDL